jgi:hypothetical protein
MRGFSVPDVVNIFNRESTSMRSEGFAARPPVSAGPGFNPTAAPVLRKSSMR